MSAQHDNFASHPTFRTAREFNAYMEEAHSHTMHLWKAEWRAA